MYIHNLMKAEGRTLRQYSSRLIAWNVQPCPGRAQAHLRGHPLRGD